MTARLRDRPLLMGVVGSLALLLVYLAILTISESFDHAVTQINEWWYWIAPLTVGFGAQIGLYTHIRRALRHRMHGAATGSVATAGGVSTTSMIACCAHHLTDVLPILGLSAAAVVLTTYQSLFMALGVLSNLVGITVMLTVMQRHSLAPDQGLTSKIFRYRMERIRNTAIVSSVILMIGLTLASIPPFIEPIQGGAVQAAGLQPVTAEENGVSFQITPLGFDADEPLAFDVRIDTHQGDLDFEFTDIATLETSDGTRHSALSWDGSPTGGHHRMGVLTFPPLGDTGSIRIIIRDVYGVPERVFQWNLGSSGDVVASSPQLNYNGYVLGGTLLAVLLAAALMNLRPRRADGKYERLLKERYQQRQVEREA